MLYGVDGDNFTFIFCVRVSHTSSFTLSFLSLVSAFLENTSIRRVRMFDHLLYERHTLAFQAKEDPSESSFFLLRMTDNRLVRN